MYLYNVIKFSSRLCRVLFTNFSFVSVILGEPESSQIYLDFFVDCKNPFK